jgi:hypothetical protein
MIQVPLKGRHIGVLQTMNYGHCDSTWAYGNSAVVYMEAAMACVKKQISKVLTCWF